MLERLKHLSTKPLGVTGKFLSPLGGTTRGACSSGTSYLCGLYLIWNFVDRFQDGTL